MRSVCKLAAQGLLWASVAGLAGCTTPAQLDALRADVDKASAAAARAEADAEKTRRELQAMKALHESATVSSTRKPAGSDCGRPLHGYKWRSLER